MDWMNEELLEETALKTINAFKMNTKHSFHMLTLFVCYKVFKSHAAHNNMDEFNSFIEKVKSRAIEILWNVKVLDNTMN